jgi:hypothetical protein
MIEVKEMDAFGTRFPKEQMTASQIEEEHAKRLKELNGSPAGIAAENKEYAKKLQDLATAILAKDSQLNLEFPFTLTESIARDIKQNAEYYRGSGIVESIESTPQCVVCGKTFAKGEIFVEDCNSNVQSCLDCTSNDIVIDGKNFKLLYC